LPTPPTPDAPCAPCPPLSPGPPGYGPTQPSTSSPRPAPGDAGGLDSRAPGSRHWPTCPPPPPSPRP
jgi:hypothetical protein